MDNNQPPLLDVQNLVTYYYTDEGVVKAVDGVDFKVYPGEIIGLVGRIGLWKECHIAIHHGSDRISRKDQLAERSCSRRKIYWN